MQRTQISLTDEERRALDAAAARTGRSISALIRDAVDAVYGSHRSVEDDLAAMRSAFGSWSTGTTRDGTEDAGTEDDGTEDDGTEDAGTEDDGTEDDGTEDMDGGTWVERVRSGRRVQGNR